MPKKNNAQLRAQRKPLLSFTKSFSSRRRHWIQIRNLTHTDCPIPRPRVGNINIRGTRMKRAPIIPLQQPPISTNRAHKWGVENLQ